MDHLVAHTDIEGVELVGVKMRLETMGGKGAEADSQTAQNTGHPQEN